MTASGLPHVHSRISQLSQVIPSMDKTVSDGRRTSIGPAPGAAGWRQPHRVGRRRLTWRHIVQRFVRGADRYHIAAMAATQCFAAPPAAVRIVDSDVATAGSFDRPRWRPTPAQYGNVPVPASTASYLNKALALVATETYGSATIRTTVAPNRPSLAGGT